MAVDAGPDAYDIFSRARAAVTVARYPDAIRYTISVAGFDGATPEANHYRAYYNRSEGSIRVAPVSEEEAAKPPPIPHGINFSLTAFLCGGHCDTGSATIALPAGRTAQSPDLVGVPILEPTYMFGLVYANDVARSVGALPVSTLPVIAVVSTARREYTVALAGIAPIDGIPSYHLLLTPIRKPHDNRLRELWIGTNDYLPRKAVIAGNFTIAPLVDVPWTVEFTIVDGAPFISAESAGSTLYLAHRRVVRDAKISFERIAASDDSFIGRPLVQPDRTPTTLAEP